MTIRIRRGLDLPIDGAPVQKIEPAAAVRRVALLGPDYLGLRPTMSVSVGDRVRLGQPLFTDKRNEGVIFTAPASGVVSEIVRGAKRLFQALVIDVAADESDAVTFPAGAAAGLNRDEVRRRLIESGLWTAFRSRPFSRIPSPGSVPHSIFVTAIDTQPLAAEPELVIDRYRDAFVAGLTALTALTDGPVFVCTRGDSRVPGQAVPRVRFEQFVGPHPAGLPGTHIHFLDPVHAKKSVWHLSYADVISIGHLITTGRILTERVVSIAGPQVRQPGLFTTRLGASLSELTAGGLGAGENRVVSGSVLSGRQADPPYDYLGRYHLQVSVLAEGRDRELLGWQRPGWNKFSVTRIYVGSWLRGKRFRMTTNTNGSARAMVPVGTYERVMPLDMLATPLLRSLITRDTDQAQALGALELDEEDLALCTFVCPGKYEYGEILRDNLQRIEKDG